MKTLVLFLLLCLDVSAQTDYKVVETKPQFAGGTSALDSYFAKNAKSLSQKHIVAKVNVNFVIDKNGNVQSPKAEGSYSAEYADEAVRLVTYMPNWTPGRQNGKNVNVRMVLPVSFLYGRFIPADSLEQRMKRANALYEKSTMSVLNTLGKGRSLSGGELDGYISNLKTVLQIYPAQDNAWRFLVSAYITEGEYKKALDAISMFETLSGSSRYMVHVYRGYVYDEQNLTAQADSEYRTALAYITKNEDKVPFGVFSRAMLTGWLEGTESKRKVLEAALANKSYAHLYADIKRMLAEMKSVNRKQEVHEEACLVVKMR